MHNLIHQRLDQRVANPEMDSRALAVAAFAIGGAVQGAIVGGVFTQQKWYEGAFKGALAGAVTMGGIMGLVALFDSTAKFTWDDVKRCNLSWGDIGRTVLSTIAPAALAGVAAGAVVAPKGERARTAGNAAVWSAVIWGLATAAQEYTRKVAPPAECR